MASDTSASAAAASPPGRKKLMILVANVVVLSSASPTCNILPAPIMSNFPHIHLQFGTELGCANCPVICCVVDTAAALSTGNFCFIAAVAKQHPHCAAKLFVPKDYNPIVLSGIVQGGGESITTELTVGFQFHLPYLTKEGNTTSILIATGPHVTVNTIIGLPFINPLVPSLILQITLLNCELWMPLCSPLSTAVQRYMSQSWMRAMSTPSIWWKHIATSLQRSMH
jgi:hypothetical protein